MNFISKVIIFFVFLGMGFLVAGWLPSKIGGDHETQTKRQADISQAQNQSREKFLNETVPKYFPLLAEFLREKSSETLSWDTEKGENKKIYLSYSEREGLVIDTEIYIGATSNDVQISAQAIQVRMVDSNTDGMMDSIRLTKSNGDSMKFQAPFDKAQQSLWDASLAMTFKLSKCCVGQ